MLKDFGFEVCNLCGSSESKILLFSDSYPNGEKGNVLWCSQCGLVYRDSFNCSSMNDGSHRVHKPYFPDPLTSARISIFEKYVQVADKYRKFNRILDLGSGEGFFLNLCSKNGWHVWGVDINEDLVAYIKRLHGIEIFNGTLEQARFLPDFFDVVTCWNVLEHIEDPYITLTEIYRILRPGGALFLRFPNASFHVSSRLVFVKLYRIWKESRSLDYSVIHRYSFCRSTICQYLSRAGFEIIKVQNANSKWTRESRSFPIKKSIGFAIENLAEIVRIASFGNWFIAPTLFVKAIKASPKKL